MCSSDLTGKLVTGATRGSADVLDAGKPIALRSAPPMSWGVPKDGLRGALRIIGELRTGGQAKADLWVWNASTDVVKFSWTEHPDVGLALMTTDGSYTAREAHMTRGKTKFQLHFLALPAGQAVKLKEFTIRLGSPPPDGPIGIVSLPLTPGDWTLQAKWTDTLHLIEGVKEWRGELSTPELKLKVTPEGATVAEPAAVKSKWPPVRQKTEVPAKKDETPAADEQGLRHKEKLQGSWQVVEAHVGGTHAPRESSEEQVWTFTRDKHLPQLRSRGRTSTTLKSYFDEENRTEC